MPEASAEPTAPAWARVGSLVASLALVWAPLMAFVAGHALSLYDDAYIYFRYVDNLSAGCGLTYTCGEAPVEGFTSPLYLAVLALGRLATRDLEVLSQLVGTGALGVALTLAVLTARAPALHAEPRWTPLAAGLAVAALLGLDDYVLLNAVVGLETPLACLVLVLVLREALRGGRPVRLAALAVLAVLARPECALFVALLPALPEGRRWRPWAVALPALAAIALARWLIFADLLPNTYWAKSGGTVRHAELGLEYVLEVATSFPAVALAPLALLARRARPAIAYTLAASALWLGFCLRSGGDSFSYSRLAAPLLPALTVLGVVGLGAALAGAGERLRAGLGGAAPAAVVVVVAAWLAYAAPDHALADAHGFANVERWAAVGRYLARAHPGATIATVPIGAIGAFSRLPLIDLVGLTDREIARAGRSVPPERLTRSWIGHERHHTEYVLARAPDLIVMTRFSAEPWTDLAQTRAGFYAEWLLLREIKEGRAPYRLLDAEVAPGLHWLMFARTDARPRASRVGRP